MTRPLAIYDHPLDKEAQTEMPFVGTEPLRPQLFVTRHNGTMVPLIAADELPLTLSLRGVPRTLSPHDVSGMTGVGTFDSGHRQYVVDSLNKLVETPTPENRSQIGSSFAKPAYRPPGSDLPRMTNSTPMSPTPPKAYGIQEQPPTNQKTPFANVATATLDRPSARPDPPPFHNFDELPIGRAPGIKEYCSYWLRHGECDYAQQGCLYRHDMPLDRPTLEKLGLRDIPRWYREKHRLGSYLAGGNAANGISTTSPTKPGFLERNWRTLPAEGVAQGTNRPPGKEVERRSSSTSSPQEQTNRKPNTTCTLPPKSVASTLKPAAPISDRVAATPKPGVSTFKPTYHAILSHQRPSPASAIKAETTTPAVPERETVSARQMRETIRMLDIYDESEREPLSQKFKTLQPQKKGLGVSANTPSTTSAASSTSGQAETEAVGTEEAVIVAKQSAPPSVELLSVSSSRSPCLKPAAATRPSPTAKKGKGKAKRKNRRGGKAVEGMGEERAKVEKLVDHD